MDRIVKPPEQESDLSPPKPWEKRPISIERWRRHRDTMLRWAYPGTRPEEWWAYEKQMQQPGRETSWLYANDELSEAELAELMPYWREKHERSWEPDFCYNAGSRGGWLEGAAARSAWYRMFDIPDALVRKWDADRRRSAKVVRKLKRAATGLPPDEDTPSRDASLRPRGPPVQSR